MKRLFWIARAAWYIRSLFGWWKPRDLSFCIDTAVAVHDSRDESSFERGSPEDEINEEISYWND